MLTNDLKTNQIKSNQIKAKQIYKLSFKSNQIRPRFTLICFVRNTGFKFEGSSTNIRPSFKKRPSHSLPQLAEYPVKHTHDWELHEHWIRLRVKIYNIFPHTAQPIQVRSSSTNIRPSFKKRPSHSLPQLAEHPVEHKHDWELREHWIRLRVRIYSIFPHTAQPIQIRSSSTNIRPSFKKWPSHSLPQLAEHPIEHTHDWELREY